jgi:hypothetical protein
MLVPINGIGICQKSYSCMQQIFVFLNDPNSNLGPFSNHNTAWILFDKVSVSSVLVVVNNDEEECADICRKLKEHSKEVNGAEVLEFVDTIPTFLEKLKGCKALPGSILHLL